MCGRRTGAWIPKSGTAICLQQCLDTRVMETERLPKPELILGIGAVRALPKLLKPVLSVENLVNMLVNLLTSRRKTWRLSEALPRLPTFATGILEDGGRRFLPVGEASPVGG